ncbi:MAG TPA: hypothetical protein V6C81_06240 [Planktothrix sp.]|jgi:hypothetical protein
MLLEAIPELVQGVAALSAELAPEASAATRLSAEAAECAPRLGSALMQGANVGKTGLLGTLAQGAENTALVPLEITGDGSTCLQSGCTKLGGDLQNSLPKVPVRADDRVAITGADGNTAEGQVKKLFAPKFSASTERVAVVKLSPGEAGFSPTTGLELTQLNEKLWMNGAGDVFNSPQKWYRMGSQVGESDLKFIPNVRAVNESNVEFVDGVRKIGPEVAAKIRMNGELIEASASDRNSMLSAMESAPRMQFKDSPLLDWKSHPVLNPSGKATNCVACTAAAIRSLESGVITSADDIANLPMADGSRLGEPFVGRFQSRADALKYITDATGTEVTSTVDHMNEMVPGKNYAAMLDIDPKAGDSLHMIFARRLESGKHLFYDAQSGLSLSPRSFASNQLTLYELNPVAKV